MVGSVLAMTSNCVRPLDIAELMEQAWLRVQTGTPGYGWRLKPRSVWNENGTPGEKGFWEGERGSSQRNGKNTHRQSGQGRRRKQVPELPTGQAREGEKCVPCVWQWKAVFYLDESNFGRIAGVWGGGV